MLLTKLHVHATVIHFSWWKLRATPARAANQSESSNKEVEKANFWARALIPMSRKLHKVVRSETVFLEPEATDVFCELKLRIENRLIHHRLYLQCSSKQHGLWITATFIHSVAPGLKCCTSLYGYQSQSDVVLHDSFRRLSSHRPWFWWPTSVIWKLATAILNVQCAARFLLSKKSWTLRRRAYSCTISYKEKHERSSYVVTAGGGQRIYAEVHEVHRPSPIPDQKSGWQNKEKCSFVVMCERESGEERKDLNLYKEPRIKQYETEKQTIDETF